MGLSERWTITIPTARSTSAIAPAATKVLSTRPTYGHPARSCKDRLFFFAMYEKRDAAERHRRTTGTPGRPATTILGRQVRLAHQRQPPAGTAGLLRQVRPDLRLRLRLRRRPARHVQGDSNSTLRRRQLVAHLHRSSRPKLRRQGDVRREQAQQRAFGMDEQCSTRDDGSFQFRDLRLHGQSAEVATRPELGRQPATTNAKPRAWISNGRWGPPASFRLRPGVDDHGAVHDLPGPEGN